MNLQCKARWLQLHGPCLKNKAVAGQSCEPPPTPSAEKNATAQRGWRVPLEESDMVFRTGQGFWGLTNPYLYTTIPWDCRNHRRFPAPWTELSGFFSVSRQIPDIVVVSGLGLLSKGGSFQQRWVRTRTRLSYRYFVVLLVG